MYTLWLSNPPWLYQRYRTAMVVCNIAVRIIFSAESEACFLLFDLWLRKKIPICLFSVSYFQLTDGGPENSIYVVMRKAPLPRNPALDVYCG